MCLCIYSGGDTGFEEKNRLMEYLKNLPAKTYTVIVNQYFNRVNQPPIPVFVWKIVKTLVSQINALTYKSVVIY